MPKFTDTQVNAIIRGPRAFRPVVFPGTEGDNEVKVAVRVLSDSEIDACRVQAQQLLRTNATQRGWDPVTVTDIDPEHFERLVQRQIVWWAYYDVETIGKDKPERFFPTYDDVAALDTTSVQLLFALYTEHQSFVAPLRTASGEEVKDLIEALGKGHGSPALLGGFERSTLVRLCISMASALRSRT